MSIFLNKKLFPLIAASALLLMLSALFAHRITSPAGDGKTSRILDFGEGASFRKFAGDLESSGIISSARLFVFYARLRGDDGKVKAGSYQFNDGMSPNEILRRMVAGETFAYRFAVPEGYSIFQIAELLENRGLFKKEAFLKACSDRTLLKELGISGRSVEGYLFPSTYGIPPKMDEENVIRLMVGQFSRVYDKRFAARAQSLGVTRNSLVTLASMIEKEAVIPAERPLIASVFNNRLKKRMPLQSDPTAVYGSRAFGGKVSKRDIMRTSPYNTYQIQGLPPGPIGNPGSEAMEAVLAPAATNYLYFVARNDGSHHFSATLAEHNRAVHKYLKP